MEHYHVGRRVKTVKIYGRQRRESDEWRMRRDGKKMVRQITATTWKEEKKGGWLTTDLQSIGDKNKMQPLPHEALACQRVCQKKTGLCVCSYFHGLALCTSGGDETVG